MDLKTSGVSASDGTAFALRDADAAIQRLRDGAVHAAIVLMAAMALPLVAKLHVARCSECHGAVAPGGEGR